MSEWLVLVLGLTLLAVLGVLTVAGIVVIVVVVLRNLRLRDGAPAVRGTSIRRSGVFRR